MREVRGYAVEEKRPGIYIVKGDILPVQIIDSRKLSEEENIWLKDLDNRLEAPEARAEEKIEILPLFVPKSLFQRHFSLKISG